jgi:hypothetical protein
VAPWLRNQTPLKRANIQQRTAAGEEQFQIDPETDAYSSKPNSNTTAASEQLQ